MKALIIAAPRSGSGKTTVTLGLMAALQRRGVRIAPFKTGPDFIDPGYHRYVTGTPSINLDGWICPPDFISSTFYRHMHAADLAIIEGAMGLFDGIDGRSATGSTAQIAALTDIPVVLVIDASGTGRSVAPLISGFAGFDPAVRVVGVIFNNVGSERHGRILAEAVTTHCGDIRVFGSLPRDEQLRIPARHLGLITAEEHPLSNDFITYLTGMIEEHLDLDQLMAAGALPDAAQHITVDTATPVQAPVRIAVARDAAFCFVYEDNLRLLQQAGGEIVPFSPLSDNGLPGGISGIYLPGGYPELFAERLATNEGMKLAIRSAVNCKMPVYAECGGFMYLTQGITDDSTLRHGFVGIFPTVTHMLPRRKALGYREIELSADTFLGERGAVMRGHEFHYSEIVPMPPQVERCYHVRKNNEHFAPEGYRINSCLASYIHLHFGSCPALAGDFVNSCRRFGSH